tara:strand:+ start:228 stop:641 length:414 start_codon:yes stop_codon:yes gene_type:complete
MIYIFESGNGYCKIGCSEDPESRKRSIEYATGLACTRFISFRHLSEMLPTEKEIHKELSVNSVFGEWFSIDFESAEIVVSKCCKMKIEKKNSAPKVMPVVQPTEKQRKWLDEEKKRTGNSEASIVRGLIQEKIENEK